jgi:hypothetical protein
MALTIASISIAQCLHSSSGHHWYSKGEHLGDLTLAEEQGRSSKIEPISREILCNTYAQALHKQT